MWVYNFVVDLIEIIELMWDEYYYRYWHIRKKFQAFIYRFHAFYRLKIWKRRLKRLTWIIETRRSRAMVVYNYKNYLYRFATIIEAKMFEWWYNSWWCGWCWLTYYVYYHPGTRDLGPSYDIYDYNPEDNMGIYLTVGYMLLLCWFLWTFVVNTSFIVSINYLLNKCLILRSTPWYWYSLTFYSHIKMPLLTMFTSISDWKSFIQNNYSYIKQITHIYYYEIYHENYLFLSSKLINHATKRFFLWFPWNSFFNYITVLSVIYICVLLSMYNTENTYYLVLYTIFLVFTFAITLIMLDLDIFAALLLLIESVVILMLFFLIIYLTPNINFNIKLNKWKVAPLMFLLVSLLSIISYVNLNTSYFFSFSLPIYFLENFYEALNESYTNDLMGIYINFYWTNSILLVVIGFLLLIASIICVVLVAFFTKMRNFNTNIFLELYNIAKTCYSFIFLRKQNLAKQGRGITSTRIFNKKQFDSKLHNEYKIKQNIFEKKNLKK